MSEREQQTALAGDLDALICRYEQEFNLSCTSAIGVLTLKVHAIMVAAMGDE